MARLPVIPLFERQTDSVKSLIADFDTTLHKKLTDDSPPVDGDKPDPAKWAEYLESDPDFRDEFYAIYQDDSLLEIDDILDPNTHAEDTDGA
jgi:hypothetical protein